MRITHRMMTQSVTRNLTNNLASLEKTATQLSMGRLFDRPSQDPVGTYKVMRITGTGLFRNEQYRRNIGEGITWLTVTEDALADTIDVMQRLRELAVYTANGTFTAEDRKMVAPEVKQYLEHLISIGNTEVNGLYIFGGYHTQARPYTIDGDTVSYEGDNGQRKAEITPGQEITFNLTGTEVFGETELFEIVNNMYNALINNNGELLGSDVLRDLDQQLTNLLQYRAEIGARMARLWSTEERLANEYIHLKEFRSKIEDIDVAEAITQFKMQENAYQAALSTGARIILPSLVDFLR
ncbi:MAG: flagellar hook-associated protein FlgL [Bacillota bacterium]|nr:flagellar hook-associated protein FlgL [Bacillota bacterium]